jgi:hypothetical protein
VAGRRGWWYCFVDPDNDQRAFRMTVHVRPSLLVTSVLVQTRVVEPSECSMNRCPDRGVNERVARRVRNLFDTGNSGG